MIKKLYKCNLNRLLVLYVLLKEKNVSKAAKCLNLTVPAVSSSFKSIRKLFNDELLVRVTQDRFMLSPKGRLIFKPLEKALKDIFVIYNTKNDGVGVFPEEVEATFRIAVPQNISNILCTSLIEEVHKMMPKCKVEIKYLTNCLSIDQITLSQFDLLIGPMLKVPNNFKSEVLYSFKLAVAGRTGHPVFRDNLQTLKDAILKYPFVKVENSHSIHDLQTALLDPEKIGCRVSLPTLQEALNIVSNTDYLCISGDIYCKKFMERYNIETLYLPELSNFDIKVSLFWDSRNDPNIQLGFLRDAAKSAMTKFITKPDIF